ncbi:MAG: flagellar hook assembly protein FlgD [Ectothiorhodospiraceae bacterium]|jgi:flagellar basal-body rod modification protein FlgD
MVDISGIGANGIGGNDSPSKPSSEVGQEDFLKMMITQLKNQDPMNPTDSAQFMSQIAQFTTASGMNELQGSFKEFQQDMQTSESLRAASLVGRDVLVDSDQGYLPSDGELAGTVRIPSSVENLTVSITDDAGQVVRSMKLGQQPAGDLPFTWDGKLADGTPMPAGRYHLSAQTSINGEPMSLQTLANAEVQSVSMSRSGKSPTLHLKGLGELNLAAVRQVK